MRVSSRKTLTKKESKIYFYTALSEAKPAICEITTYRKEMIKRIIVYGVREDMVGRQVAISKEKKSRVAEM